MPGNGKYTEQLANQIADLVAEGVPQKHAAIACGIGENTFYEWVKDKQDFGSLLEQRRAEAMVDRVRTIKEAKNKHGLKEWTAAAWFLERQYPDEFGAKPEKKDIKITVEIRDCTADAPAKVQEPEVVDLIECECIDSEDL